MNPVQKATKYVITSVAGAIALGLVFLVVFTALGQLRDQTSNYPAAQAVINQSIQAEHNLQGGVDMAGTIEEALLAIGIVVCLLVGGYYAYDRWIDTEPRI